MGLQGPETSKEALINVKVAILKKNYPEGKHTKDEKELILEELGRSVLWNS
jgi:hypothetical protein